MAEVMTRSADFPRRLVEVLRDGLRKVGIDAEVETERVPDLDLHRVLLTAPEFHNLWASERQDLVWRIIGQNFNDDDKMRISIILTLTPDELEGK